MVCASNTPEEVTADELSVRAGQRTPVHASITRSQISDLVERFYDKIRKDQRLGAIFNERIEASSGGDWQPHLTKMKRFWASVLLKTGEYKGQPVAVHNGLPDLEEEDFPRWLGLFKNTADDVFEPQAAELVYANGLRIAQSLYLARFGKPGIAPPF